MYKPKSIIPAVSPIVLISWRIIINSGSSSHFQKPQRNVQVSRCEHFFNLPFISRAGFVARAAIIIISSLHVIYNGDFTKNTIMGQMGQVSLARIANAEVIWTICYG